MYINMHINGQSCAIGYTNLDAHNELIYFNYLYYLLLFNNVSGQTKYLSKYLSR